MTSTALAPMARAREAAGATPGVWTETAYNSVFKDSGRSPEARDDIRLDTAKNDHEGAQIVLRGPAAFTVQSVDFSTLTGPTDTLPASAFSYHPVGYEYLDRNSYNGWEPDNFVVPTIRKGAGDYPDRLLNTKTISVPANQTQAIWVRVHVPATAAGGVYTGRATVRTTNGDLSVPITVNARNVVIPPANQSEFTNVLWHNFLGLTSWDPGKGDTVELYYGYKRYTADWWRLMDNWTENMKRYRQNSLQLPLIALLRDGGSTVDAAGKYTFNWRRFDEVAQRFLDKGAVHTLELFIGAGPKNRENNPQFPRYLMEVLPKNTNQVLPDFLYWDSPEAENWYKQFYPALRQHLVDKGWHDQSWIHVADEPGEGSEGWYGIEKRLRHYWPDSKIGDAIVNATAPGVADKADIVIPNLHTYTVMTGADGSSPFDVDRRAGKPLWFYNCNIPAGNHLNRFIDQPQWHQRQTMWLAYNKGATGYLHWAYGNWQFEMKNQTVKGDGYIVRPDKDNHTVESSPRYESLRDGMEDWEVLNYLGKTNPGLAHDLANSVVQASDTYSPDVEYMQRVRRIALDAAAGLPVVAKNLARNRVSKASSGDSNKAVDGDSATGWQPASGNGTNWVQVDLGRQAQVDGVRLKWGATHASKYRVLTSFDGVKWAEAGVRADNPVDDLAKPGGDDFVGLNTKARHIRVEATASSGGATPYQLLDLEVAGNLLLQQNLLGGKSYAKTAPAARFGDSGNEATDGVLSDNWGDGKSFGYELSGIGATTRPSVTVDLGYQQVVGTVRVHAYQEYPDYRPDLVTVSTSSDGLNFGERAKLSFVNGASSIWYDLGFAPTPARWVRVTFDKRMGNKYQSGMFIDEIEAYGAGQAADVTPGSTAYQWNDAGGAGHEVVFAPTANGTLGRWDWSAAAGLRRDDLGGGPIAGKTSGYAWNNQQHAVARGLNGKLLHWWWIEGEAAPHRADWGGDAAGDPAAVVWSGQQHIFARSSSGDLQHWWWDPADGELRLDRWGGAPGPIVGTPSTYVSGNQLHVVARGANNHLYHWWWVSGEFEPQFADWGGEAHSDPTTFVWRGQQHVYARAADGQLYHWFWDAGSGLNRVKWTGAPGKFVGAPSAFKTDNQQHVVARGPNNTLYHWWWTEGGGVRWEDLGGQVYADPVAFAFADQHQFFAQSATNTLYHWWWTPQDGWHQNDWGGSVRYPAP
ncbi:hypothetical protein GCM10009534_63450 [Kribbella sandramycini]